MRASIQLCLPTDNHDADDTGHLLVRGWWSRVTRSQKTGQNPLLLLPLGDVPGSRQLGQALGRLLVSAGVSEQEAPPEEVGNNAAALTGNYRLPRHAGTGMHNKTQAKF